MSAFRQVIIPSGRASVSDKRIEQAVLKVMRMREAGLIKPKTHNIVKIVADKG